MALRKKNKSKVKASAKKAVKAAKSKTKAKSHISKSKKNKVAKIAAKKKAVTRIIVKKKVAPAKKKKAIVPLTIKKKNSPVKKNKVLPVTATKKKVSPVKPTLVKEIKIEKQLPAQVIKPVEVIQKPKTASPGPVYVEADKGGPKNKVKTILISQPKPDSEKSPYLDFARKYNVKIDFRQFIQVEGVSARDFRQEKVNLTDHHAVILTSRIAIDHYFRMCNEMRYTVPETTKYFCLSESVAYYLQKYVQYRKRKIFYGHQTIADLVGVIKKHREEKFLLPVSDVHREQIVDFLDDLKIQYTKAIFYRTISADLSDFNGKLDYDVVVFFTPAGIQSLFKNFPNFKQGDIRIGAFGAATAKAIKDHGLRLDIAAPNLQSPSMIMSIENYIKEVNKK